MAVDTSNLLHLVGEFHATIGANDAACCPPSIRQAEHANNTGDLLTVARSSSSALGSFIDSLWVDTLSWCRQRGDFDEGLVQCDERFIITPVHVCGDWAWVDGIDGASLGKFTSPSSRHAF